MEICWKTQALSLRNLNGCIKLSFMNNPDINFSWIFIEMIIYRNVTYSIRSLPQFVGDPLDLEALLSLYSLLVNTALRSMLPNVSLVMEFLGKVFTNVFLKNFSRMKRWWREELQLPVTIKRSFVTSYKWKTHCLGDIGSFDSFRSKFFANVISRFKSFALNKYDLRILSSVFLIEIFDLRGKELRYAKELLLNHYRKTVQNSMRLQGMWLELKL